VLDEIIPFLPQIPSREPAVLMGILGIYKLALNHKKLGITKEVIATKVLPFLIPLCIENGLTIPQFNALVALVKQMFESVESEHRMKLEQLNSVADERKALESNMPVVSPTSVTNKPTNNVNNFAGVGIEAFSLEDKQKLSKQQEVVKVLHSQSPLDPIPTQKDNKNSSKVIDLSSTLGDFKLTPPKNFTQPQVQPQANYTPALTSIPNNLTTQMQPSFNNFNQVRPNYQPMTNQSFQSNGWNQWSSFSNQNVNNSPWMGNNGNLKVSNSVNDNKNWSALDNLLPTSNNANGFGVKTPMNMMATASKPLLPSNTNTNTNGNDKKGLTNDDIMDLLS